MAATSSSKHTPRRDGTAFQQHSLLLCIAAAALLLAAVGGAQAQQQTTNGQGKILWPIGQWLSGSQSPAALTAMGWTDGGNPCMGWGGVGCNSDGYVTSINLNGKGLTGSIPSDPGLWSGLTALTSLDLANNALQGSVPSAIKSAPVLTNLNLVENKGLCGFLPSGLPANTAGTNVGVECGSATATASPAPLPLPSTTAPVTTPDAANTTATDTPAATTPSPAAAALQEPAPAAADNAAERDPAAAPVRPPTEISSAPICSCALKGFGSQDCAGALAKECRTASPPAVCNATAAVTNDTEAATALAEYLAGACFSGQNMDTSVCTCVQNLLGNDCAKARVTLCVKGDPLCLPIQNVVGESWVVAGDAAQQVASALDAQCSVAEPTQQGVKATMEFPELSMGQYISKQYTQNVANALSSVTNVPTSSISTLDVRPFTGAARPGASSSSNSAVAAAAATPKRMLLQEAAAAAGSGGNGVQASYFLATDDPAAVSHRLTAAATDGTLSARLAQYGINAQAGGLRVQNFLQSPPAGAPSSGFSFPLWALAPIIAGGVLLLGLLALGLWCCCCRKARRGKKAVEYAPPRTTSTKQQQQQRPNGKGSNGSTGRGPNGDVSAARDMQPKGGYGAAPGSAGYGAPPGGAPVISATITANSNYKAGSGAPYKPGSSNNQAGSYINGPSGGSYDYYDKQSAPVNIKLSKSVVNGTGLGSGTGMGGAAAAGAGAAAAAAGMKRAGSSGSRAGAQQGRPGSPASSKGSGSNVSPVGIAGAGVGAGAGAGAAGVGGGPAHLSLKTRVGGEYEDSLLSRSGSGNSNTLTPWEAASRPAGGSSILAQQQQQRPAAMSNVAASGVTGGRPVAISAAPAGAAGAGVGMGAAVAGGAAAGGTLGMQGSRTSAGSGSMHEAAGGSAAWKSNVRPASGHLQGAGASAGSSNNMMAHPAGKSAQQAERAKFWAQFQDTWQQVRQTQNMHDNEPGSPSSGTNWTDITDARTFRH